MADGVTRARMELDSDERYVSLRRALGVTSFGINQMSLAPGQRARIHRHEHQEEVYLVLSGRLTVLIEREPVELERGELLRVPGPVRRQLLNRSSERVVLLALGGHGEHAGRDALAYPSWETAEGAPPQQVPLPEDLPPGDRVS